MFYFGFSVFCASMWNANRNEIRTRKFAMKRKGCQCLEKNCVYCMHVMDNYYMVFIYFVR